MFKPLSFSYSTELSNDLHRSQGLIPINKGDFFPLFWTPWISSFKRETILKAFEATGIWPKDRNAILKRFHPQTPDEDQSTRSSPSLNNADFRKIREVVQSVVKEGADKEAKKVTQAFHHLQVQNELLHYELEGLREAITTKKKHM